MRKALTAAMGGLVLPIFMTASALGGIGTHYVIMIDASASNLMVTEAAHSLRVSGDVIKDIGELQMGDDLTITTIGEFAGNMIVETQVDKSFPPEIALQQLGAMIAGTPQAIQQMGGPAQVTHIQGALQLTASRLDCSTPTKIYVLTDGLETGDTLRPEPIFSGCESMVMIGVIAPTPAETEAVTDAWTEWCQTAGFLSCSIRY